MKARTQARAHTQSPMQTQRGRNAWFLRLFWSIWQSIQRYWFFCAFSFPRLVQLWYFYVQFRYRYSQIMPLVTWHSVNSCWSCCPFWIKGAHYVQSHVLQFVFGLIPFPWLPFWTDCHPRGIWDSLTTQSRYHSRHLLTVSNKMQYCINNFW